ncbi:MAG: ABC transporter ATP-binding protein [Opitutales bacterium]|nr:ABC transporter ATP-binding protein [Opitutales bacterium]
MSDVVLQARGLTKNFASPAGPLPVLTDVSLEVFAGESVSIRGSSGSGKTTLLQLLGGLDQPDAGEVRILGPGATLVAPRSSLGHGVGFVFQNYQLMPELTALENVALAALIAGVPAAEATAAARALLGQVGLGARLEHLPAKLSGGECQRVALARALVNRPSVILADEPTGNLDERTGAEIMDLLLGVVADRGAALVLVTHSREFAERASRRLVLSGGVLTPA